MHVRGKMLKQESKALVNGRCLDDMVIFQHQGHRLSQGQKLIEQRGQESLQRWLRSLQTLEKGRADVRGKTLQSGSQIGPETRGIVVLVVKREPRDLASTFTRPGREQRRLAKARPSREQR